MRDPFAVVAMLGNRLERERTGWRDAKALCLIAGGEGGWAAASALADALGLDPEQQENIYRELADGARDRARAPLAAAS